MYAESRFLTRILNKARKKSIGRFLVDYNDNRQTVILVGTGRSGTTWVTNIINYANAYRLMFEPFYPEAVNELARFRYKQYLRPDNHDAAYLKPAKLILSGRIRNEWIDGLNRKLIARKRLIKDIRAHHLLAWIKAHFPEIPIVLLLRHPCAVAHSKMRLNWDTHLDAFLSQGELMHDFLDPFRVEIESARDIYEKHVFIWCIENFVPLEQLKTGEIHLAFYEHFCTNPAKEIGRLFSFLDQPYHKQALKAAQRPSQVSRQDSPILTGEDLTKTWTKHITEKQVQRAVEILTLFGLQRIYSEDPMPLLGDKSLLI